MFAFLEHQTVKLCPGPDDERFLIKLLSCAGYKDTLAREKATDLKSAPAAEEEAKTRKDRQTVCTHIHRALTDKQVHFVFP